MSDQLMITVLDEFKAAAIVANVDVAATIQNAQETIIQRANILRCRTLLTAFVQLPGAVQDQILQTVSDAMEQVTKDGTLHPERANIVRQISRGV